MLQTVARLLRQEAKAGPSVAPDATDATSAGWLAELFGARRSHSGISVTAETYHRCPTAYASVAVIAQAVAQLPLHLFRRTADGGKERATDHPLYDLLTDQPNEWTSSYDFRLSMQSSVLRYDQGAFAFINRVGGRIEELVQIPSPQCSVAMDPDTREPVYKVTTNGRTRIYDRGDILHLQAMDGVAPLTAAREAIAVMIAMERYASKLFGRGARPSGVLTLPKGMAVDAVKKAAASWNKAHGGEEGGGGTAVLEDGITWQQTQFSSVDSQFLEVRAQQVIEILRPFRIPPPMVQDFGRATWSNSEESGRQFLSLALLPQLQMWQGAIRRSLLSADDRKAYVAEFMIDDLARANLAARMEAYAKAIGCRVLLPNEARAMENRAPLPGGDEFPPVAGAAPALPSPETTTGDEA